MLQAIDTNSGMVLFYCTFVAMKRQDSQEVEHPDLLDEFELEISESGTREEQLLHASKVLDEQLVHNLRLYQDRSSGVLRLEASASRGAMENVPLWTAFVNRYSRAGDIHWAHYEGRGLVSLVDIRPPPYIFIRGYALPRNRNGEYLLQFTRDSGTCRSAGLD